MPPGIPNDEIEKLREPENLESSKKKTTERGERTTTTKDSTFDLTKADSTSTGIIDILDNPDVAVWSKGIMKKANTPADKVQEPYHIESTTIHTEHREEKEKQSHLQQAVDPANKEDVAKAIAFGTSLTDKAADLVQGSKKATSSEG
jgi:hypothetical protein